MLIHEFVNKFKEAKVTNSKVTPNAISEYLKKELEIKTYIPFQVKREIVELVVARNIDIVNGVKKSAPIDQYLSFVTAMLCAHTNLEFGDDVLADYDLLAENGLLNVIVEEFRASYDECDALLKMVLASELEDNNINVFVGMFLNDLSQKIDDVTELLKGKLNDFDVGSIFKQEDLAKLKGFLDIYNK